MKTMIKMLILAAFTLTQTLAANSEQVKMTVTGEGTVKLIMSELTSGVQIQLMDHNHYVLYEEEVQDAQGYSKLYNLKELPDGKYVLELDFGTKVRSFGLSITKGRVYHLKFSSKEYFKPVVRQNKDQVAITHLSPSKGTLKVVVYDADSKVVFKDKLQGSMSLGRRYDIGALPAGEYQIYLASEGKSYYHTLRLQQP